MRLMYSEYDDAIRILRDGFQDGYSYREALAVAKFYRHVLGYGDGKTKSEYKKFLKLHSPFYNIINHFSSVNRLLNYSKREFVDTTSSIKITESELNSIDEIKNHKSRVILLILLVVSKIKSKDYTELKDWKYVRQIVSKHISNRDIKDCMKRAYDAKLIKEKYEITDKYLFLFLQNYEPSSSVFIIENDNDIFRLPEKYKVYKGGEILFCKNCGSEYVKESNRHRYCEQCKNEKHKENKRNWWKKRGLDI